MKETLADSQTLLPTTGDSCATRAVNLRFIARRIIIACRRGNDTSFYQDVISCDIDHVSRDNGLEADFLEVGSRYI